MRLLDPQVKCQFIRPRQLGPSVCKGSLGAKCTYGNKVRLTFSQGGDCGRTTSRVLCAAVWSSQEIWCILTASAAVGQVVQERTSLGRYVSGPLLALAVGLSLAGLGILPLACQPYNIVYESLLPFASALLLLETDLRWLFASAADILLAFGIACIGTLLGTCLTWMLLGARLGPDGWKMAGALCGTYIGGSINFAAISRALALDAALVPAAMAADNLATALFLAAISVIPDQESSYNKRQLKSNPLEDDQNLKAEVTAETMIVSLAGAAAVCAVSQRFAACLGSPAWAYALTAVLASGLASMASALLPAHVQLFAGSRALGGAVMLLFFVVMGAEAGSFASLASAGWIAAFICMQLAIHVVFLLTAGRVFLLPTQALLTASNAAVGGPATAAAMATARQWTHMVQPALLLGSLGYTMGTAIGCAVGQVLRSLPAGAVF
eukprot:jgi/Botrbrau1/7460/Bobra.0083s0025.1